MYGSLAGLKQRPMVGCCKLVIEAYVFLNRLGLFGQTERVMAIKDLPYFV
jgi:hypothetical protein